MPHNEDYTYTTTLNLPPPPPSPPVAASRHDSLGVTMPYTARSSSERPQLSHPSPHAAWPRRPDSGNVVMAKVGEAVSNLSLLSSYEVRLSALWMCQVRSSQQPELFLCAGIFCSKHTQFFRLCRVNDVGPGLSGIGRVGRTMPHRGCSCAGGQCR